MSPHVTVLMSVYNSAEYLAESIDSILNQTFKDFEFLIFNDGSTDTSREILLSYSDKRIELIENEVTLGLTKALNKGIDLARGKYIARMDADDIAMPDRLQNQFEFMENNPDVDVCGSWYAVFGKKSAVTKTPVQHHDIRDSLFFHNCIAHSTTIIRKDTLERHAIRYSEEFRYAQDYELWCREINRLKFFNIPKILLHYRVHDQQIRIKEKIEQVEAANSIRKRNINSIGLELSDYGQTILGEIINGKISFENKELLIHGVEMLDAIGKQGEKIYGDLFIQKIRNYMYQCAEASIVLKKTSLSLFIRVLSQWDVFPSLRCKIRYVYHSVKNMIFCIGIRQ